MGALLADIVRVALGIGTPFSFIAWAYVSVLLLVVGPLIAQVGPRVVDPPARLLATRPDRVALWLPLSFLATFGVILFLAITIVGIPLAFLVPIAALLVGGAGYVALARLLGETLLRRLGVTDPGPMAAAAAGIVCFRLVRLLPFVGAAAHSLIAWIGFAAACSVLASLALAWHRRRMPDAEQFRGETLVEWYPDGDPGDGVPAPGTGRPVLGNVRGDEERKRPAAPDAEEPA